MRSTQCFGAVEVPQTANLNASASVDFPLPRGPIMQVRPRGTLTLKPGRNPPLISIFSTSHIGPTSVARETRAVLLPAHRELLSVPHWRRNWQLTYCTPNAKRVNLLW